MPVSVSAMTPSSFSKLKTQIRPSSRSIPFARSVNQSSSTPRSRATTANVLTAYHAIAEEGVPYRLIAEAIGRQVGGLAMWVAANGPASGPKARAARWT